MRVLDAESSAQIRAHIASCLAQDVPTGTFPAQAPPPTAGILTEQHGIFLTFWIAETPLRVAGVLAPQVPLHLSLTRICQKVLTEIAPLPAMQNPDHDIRYEARLVTGLEPCRGPEELEIGRHGILLSSRGRTQYLLPEVPARQGWTALGALEHLCTLLSLPPGTWRDRTATLSRFELIPVEH